ncbi:MAG TPA: glycosyltransferase [Candidatus Omnitrophota bacterium]|nr:glycosyltransferase [Candidatus Omnitrophota bacterium]
MDDKFKFSVLMTVWGGERPAYLDKAIDSVIRQTVCPNELVIVEDGELTWDLTGILEMWQTKEKDIVRRVKTGSRVGLAKALNIGLQNCTCDWVARMDSDDISVSNRFEKQREYLINNPGVSVLGGFIEEYNENMEIAFGVRRVPVTQDGIVKYSKWRSPMNHVSVIYKRSDVLSVGGYSNDMVKLQDYNLWAKMMRGGYLFENISEILVYVRTGESFLDRRGGLAYFKYEYSNLMFLYKIGHIGFYQFVFGVMGRFVIRMVPGSIRRMAYQCLRKT